MLHLLHLLHLLHCRCYLTKNENNQQLMWRMPPPAYLAAPFISNQIKSNMIILWKLEIPASFNAAQTDRKLNCLLSKCIIPFSNSNKYIIYATNTLRYYYWFDFYLSLLQVLHFAIFFIAISCHVHHRDSSHTPEHVRHSSRNITW